MADWFYGKDNTQHGPVSDLEIRNLISTGQIDPATIIWREGMTDWLPLSDVPEFQPTAGASGTPGDQVAGATPYATPQTYAGQPPYQGTIPTDGLSIASLVCGIFAIISCYIWGVFGLPAVICGHMSLKKINTSPTPIAGKGMAIAGLVTGYIGIVFQLLAIVGIIFAFTSGRAI
jgi:hypothetical protein